MTWRAQDAHEADVEMRILLRAAKDEGYDPETGEGIDNRRLLRALSDRAELTKREWCFE